ncbi:hypothetical protein BGZ52_000294, partial [Haplosporangium bisporale]
MAPLLKYSISLILVATSALLALENTSVAAVAVPSPASDPLQDIKPVLATTTALLAAPTAIPALLPIGTLPTPADKEYDPKVEPSDASKPEAPQAPMMPIHRPYQLPPLTRPREPAVNQKRAQESSQWGQQ